MYLPGTYVCCMSGHYYAQVRGDEECPICEEISSLRGQIALERRVREKAELEAMRHAERNGQIYMERDRYYELYKSASNDAIALRGRISELEGFDENGNPVTVFKKEKTNSCA